MNLNIQQIQRYAHKNSFFDLNFSCLYVSHSEKNSGVAHAHRKICFCPCMNFTNALIAITATIESGLPVWINIFQWLSGNWPTGKAFATSKLVFVPCKISGTIWASGETFRRAHWPMPMKIEIGASMPISVMFLSVLPGTCTEMKISLSNLTIWHMPLILPQSTFVCLFFPGRISEKRRVR